MFYTWYLSVKTPPNISGYKVMGVYGPKFEVIFGPKWAKVHVL